MLTSSREYLLVSGKKRTTQGRIRTMFIAAKNAYVPHPILSNMGPVTITWTSIISLFAKREGRTDHEEIPQPVRGCGQSVCRSSNSKRGNLSRVEPSHTQPADREPCVEEEKAQDRDNLGRCTIVPDRDVKTGKNDESSSHGDSSGDHQFPSTKSFDEQESE